MFTRIVARFLIFLQIYGILFQGIAHANFTDHYPINEQIYLHGSVNEYGKLIVSLGTNDPLQKDGINSPKMLKTIEIPDFKTLKTPSRPLPLILPLVKPQQIIREKSITLEEDFSGSEESFAEASSASEISEDELDDNLQIGGEIVSFEYSGVTRTALGALFKVQGLNVFLNNSGEMFVEGCQTDFSKPIFLSCQKSVVFNNVNANKLQLSSPRIVGTGISVIDCLSLGKLNPEDGDKLQNFTNYGNLNARELFLNNLNGDNQGTISAANVGVHGQVEYAGEIKTDKLVLSESAFFKLTQDSRADIKALFLSKDSHFENHQQDKDKINIGVLNSLESSVTNYGSLMIAEIAVDSAFQAITNRHFMGIAQGDLKVETFENSHIFGLGQGSLLVKNGTNTGTLKANSLDVTQEFTNDKTGIATIPLVTGSGELVNGGKIETADDLAFDVQKFTNQKGGLVKAKSIAGLANLQKFTNDEDSGVDAGESLSFANTTEVINQGHLRAKAMTLVVAKTAQSGEIKAQTLKLTCGGSFENLGDIDVEQELSLALTKLINRGSLKVAAVTVGAGLTSLENAKGALIEVKDSTLAFVKTEVVNDGTLKGGSYSFSGGSLAQSGVIDGKSLKLGIGTAITTTDSQTINLSGNLEQSSAGSWSIRGTINAYKYTRFGDIDLHGTLSLRDSFDGRGTIHKGGKLSAKRVSFYSDVLLNGDLVTDTLDFEKPLSKFTVNGQALIKQSAKIGSLEVGEHGVLQGHAGSSLSLSLAEEAEISGLVDVDVLLAAKKITLAQKGRLISRKKTELKSGLDIAQEAEAELHDLKVSGDVTNHGKLKIIGMQPNQGVINFTNSGIASVDANQPIPVVKKDQPQNLTRIDCGVNSEKENKTVLTFIGNECIKLSGADSPDEFTYPFPSAIGYCHVGRTQRLVQTYIDECVKFFNSTNTGRYFLEDTKWTPPEGLAAQCGTQGFAPLTNLDPLKEYREWYQQNYLRPLQESALITKSLSENWEEIFATNSPIKLQLNNQKGGKLVLKSGKFELAGSKALINDGVITQENSYIDWLVGQCNHEISGGTWQVKESLGLLGCIGKNVGKLLVKGDLSVLATGRSTFLDGLQALEGLKQVQARKVIVYADKVKNVLATLKPVNKTYPWPLEMHIKGNIYNSFEITTPELSIYARNLQTIANLSASTGPLYLEVEDTLNIAAILFSKKTMFAKAKHLKIEGMDVGTSESHYFYSPNIGSAYGGPGFCGYGANNANANKFLSSCLIKHLNGNGLYSESGIHLEIAELLKNHYGTIWGTYFNIEGKQLINTAGLICATAPDLLSKIKVNHLENVRDPIDVLIWGWCNPNSTLSIQHDFTYYRKHWETSEEAVIVTNGNLEIIYHTLKMLISSITSYDDLTLVANGVSLHNPVEGAVLPGTTNMIKRNGHVNRIVAKGNIEANLGNANVATLMSGQNINVKAALLTIQSLGFSLPQQIQIFDMFAQSSTNAYKRIGNGNNGYVDTVIPYKDTRPPMSIVVLGKNANAQMGRDDTIIVPMSKRAIKQQIQSLFFSHGRGIEGLGLGPNDFFKNVFVRNHPDTRSKTRLTKFGDQTHEIEYLYNATLTPQTLLEFSEQEAIAYLQFKYEESLNSLQSEDRVAAFLQMAIKPESQGNRRIKAKEKVSIKSESDTNINTSVEGLEVRIKSKGTTTISSDVIHYQCGGGDHWQVLDRTNIEAVNKLVIEGQNIHFKAVNTKSGKETRFLSKGNIVDESVGLSSQTTSYHEDGYNRHKSIRQQVSNHSSDGNIVSSADEKQHLFAPSFECKRLIIEGLEGVDIREVHDVDEYESFTETDNGWFGGSTKTQTLDQYSRSKGAKFKVEESVEIFSFGDVNITNPNLLTPLITLDSVDGVVKILAGTNSESHSSSTKSEGMFWQSVELKGSSHKTYTMPQIQGEVIINSKQNAILQKVHGQVLEYAERIKVEGGGKLVFEDLYESHQYFHVEQDGPTAAFAAVVAIAISLATANPGSGLGAMVTSGATATMGATAAGVLGLMTTGAFMGICSQAGMALLQTKGNVGKAAKILASKEGLKKIAKSAALSGLIGNGCSEVSVESLCFNVVRNTVDAGLNKAMFNEDFGKGFKQGLVQAGMSNVTGYVAEKIGDLHTEKAMKLHGTNDVTHVVSHTVSGAIGGGLTNALTGGDIKSGMESGAIGGGVGTVMIKTLGSKNDTQKERETKVKVADFTATCVAFALKKDPNTAYQASNNANVHNDLKHRPYLEQIGVVQEGEQVYEEEELDPRIKAARKAYNDYGELYASLDPVQKEMHKLGGYNAESIAQSAYKGTQRIIAENALAKSAMGRGVSEYERQVIVDAGKDAAISAMTWGAITGTLNLVSKTVSTYVAKKAFKEMLAGDVVSSHVKFKTPNGHSNSNFMYGVNSNRNVMPVKGTGTFGNGYGLGSQGLGQSKQPTVQSLANDYGSAIKPKFNNELTHRIDGSKIPGETQMLEKKVLWKPVTSNGQDAIKLSVISDHKLNKALGRVDAKVGKGLIKAPREIDGTKFGHLFQDHHVISNKNPLTKDHKLLELAEFDLNSTSNMILLPTKKGSNLSTTKRSIHDGKHIDLVSERLEKEMNKVIEIGQPLGWKQPEYNKALMDIIAKEKVALKSGDRILNKNHRPFATDGEGFGLKKH